MLGKDGQALGHLPSMVGRHGFHSFARGENTGFGPRSRQESQSQKQNFADGTGDSACVLARRISKL